MDSAFGNILSQLIMIVGGVLLAGISALGGFYVKKLTDRIKRNSLVNEINHYITWVTQADSFKSLSKEEKIQAILEMIQPFAIDNGITISEKELVIMIEMSGLALSKLNAFGLKLTQAKKLARKEA